MIGMSNGMNVGDHTINGNQNHTEQHKKDWFDCLQIYCATVNQKS